MPKWLLRIWRTKSFKLAVSGIITAGVSRYLDQITTAQLITALFVGFGAMFGRDAIAKGK